METPARMSVAWPETSIQVENSARVNSNRNLAHTMVLERSSRWKPRPVTLVKSMFYVHFDLTTYIRHFGMHIHITFYNIYTQFINDLIILNPYTAIFKKEKNIFAIYLLKYTCI